MRRPEIEDADTAHNARVARANNVEFGPPRRTSSTSSMPRELGRSNARRSSIVAFAKGFARHVPNMRLFPPPDPTPDHHDHPLAGCPDNSVRTSNYEGKGRKLSFVLPTINKPSGSADNVPQPNSDSREHVGNACPRPPSSDPFVKGSLRDRRKVNLDLSLPVENPNLPPRSRLPVVQLNGITPSRPRSPKTPWVRNDAPKYPLATTPANAPIMEEDYIGRATVREGSGAMGLLPGEDPILSSHSPKLERLAYQHRDRSHNSRPRYKQNRSGRSKEREEALAHTPDGTWTPDYNARVTYEQPSRTLAELDQLGQTAKEVRSKRWRWARSATRSSDGVPQTPMADPPVNRRFSINPFKRSGRITEQPDQDNATKQSPSPPSRLWWIGRQTSVSARPEHTTSNNNNNITIPPSFVPPGLNRVPTSRTNSPTSSSNTALAFQTVGPKPAQAGITGIQMLSSCPTSRPT
jgi:hypothetical protein